MNDEKRCSVCDELIPRSKIDPDPNINFRTANPEWLMNKYYHALGTLLSSYSSVETNLALMVQSLISTILGESNANDSTYSNVSSVDTSSEDARESARRSIIKREAVVYLTERLGIAAYRDTSMRLLSIEGRDAASIAAVKGIFAHVETIGHLRNRLAHNGAYPDMRNKEEWFYTSNSHVKSGKHKLLYFQIDSLLKASRDLRVIPDRLSAVLNPEDQLEKSDNAITKAYVASEAYRALIAERDGPWHYSASDLGDDPMVSLSRNS
jgi:hypothetical protein